jgi:hypothetical protein
MSPRSTPIDSHLRVAFFMAVFALFMFFRSLTLLLT